ncbi:hypothetical protein [Sorangium sp. So ce861]|uniref:hypothetical protein n=1 Tax=Sorangium sp. So ce861 TaxID=3133323 RepID=UPI003F5E7AAA
MARNNGEPLERQHIYHDLNVLQVSLRIARDKGIPFVDPMASSAAWVDNIGRAQARAFYATGDATHPNEEGAKAFAEIVAEGVRARAPGLAVRQARRTCIEVDGLQGPGGRELVARPFRLTPPL